jgi:hypothetical protein
MDRCFIGVLIYGLSILKSFDFSMSSCDFEQRGLSMKRVAIYLRVSTSKQETGNQRLELEAVAARSRWQVVRVFEDTGISGAKGRDKRPGLDAMMKAVIDRGLLCQSRLMVQSLQDRPMSTKAAPASRRAVAS